MGALKGGRRNNLFQVGVSAGISEKGAQWGATVPAKCQLIMVACIYPPASVTYTQDVHVAVYCN